MQIGAGLNSTSPKNEKARCMHNAGKQAHSHHSSHGQIEDGIKTQINDQIKMLHRREGLRYHAAHRQNAPKYCYHTSASRALKPDQVCILVTGPISAKQIHKN